MSSRSTKLARLSVLSGVLLLAVSPFAAGQSDPQKPEPSLAVAGAGKKSSKTEIVYRPPQRGAPARRVSGGTRGTNAGSLVLLAEDGVDNGDDGLDRFFVHRRIRSCLEFVAVVDAVTIGVDVVRPRAELEFGQIR